MIAMLIIGIILSFVLKQFKDRLMFLILNMQLVKSLTMYEVKMPANVEIYLGFIKTIVDGEMLKPDFVINIIWPGETLLSLISGKVPLPQKGNL
jgi:hypothetical protein